VFRAQPFDICINCSGSANVSDSFKNPNKDFEQNVIHVQRILEAIRRHNPDCHYINLSSAAVYGNTAQLPIQENQRTQAISPYGYHKKLAEDLCKQFTELYDLKTCPLRIFSAYGPGLKKQLFWDLFKKASKSEITLHGSGNETRDFIYIEDLEQQIDLACLHSNWHADIINCANGKQTRIADVVATLTHLLDWHGTITYTEKNRKGDPTFLLF